MKQCTTCQELKPETIKYFNLNNRKKLSAQCKICRNAYLRKYNKKTNIAKQNRERKQSYKVECIELLGAKCLHCEIEYTGKNGSIFDFHHTNPNQKEFTIGSHLNFSRERIISEAEKCILLCSNCHRQEHSGEY